MIIKKTYENGSHILVDGLSNAPLNNKEFIKTLLLRVAKKARMNPLSNPIISRYNAREEKNSKITGILTLVEGTIIINTYPHQKMFFIDVFSSRNLNLRDLVNFITRALEVTRNKFRLVLRGW